MVGNYPRRAWAATGIVCLVLPRFPASSSAGVGTCIRELNDYLKNVRQVTDFLCPTVTVCPHVEEAYE